MKKRILSIVLTLCMALTLLPATAFAAEIVDSGTCGDNVTWTLDDAGNLTISGTGPMWNYTTPYDDWWRDDNLPDAPFYNKTVQAVIIEDGVTSIGSYSFFKCGNMTRITIPDSVTYIGNSAFQSCSKLTSVMIPDNVTFIGDSAFRGCQRIKSVTIPSSVTSIASEVFYGCTSLTNVTIPSSVTSIGYDAFNGCTGLTSVTIPSSVTSISGQAFRGCTGLSSIMIPSSVTYIGGWAFYGSGLTSLYYDGTAAQFAAIEKDLHEYKGYSCTGYFADGEYTGWGICGCIFNEDDLQLKDNLIWTLNVNGLLTISGEGTMMWYGGSYDSPFGESVKSIVIGPGVTNIGDKAFCRCGNLTSVTIPDSVTRIGDYAFDGCSGLTTVTIPDSVKYIGEYAFDACSGLTSITVPSSVTSIGRGVFSYCSGLTSVTIPESVKSIGERSFSGCRSLTSVTIPASVTSIGKSAFSDCAGLQRIFIPSSLNYFDDNVFTGCSQLQDVCYGGTEADWELTGYEYAGLAENVRMHYQVTDFENHFQTVHTDPTCTEPGSDATSCACGYAFDAVTIDPLGHDTEIVGLAEATCTETGYTGDAVCKVCGETVVHGSVIPALGHKIVRQNALEATCTEAGYYGDDFCTRCNQMVAWGYELPALGHDYNDVVTAPTCTEQGYTTRTCTRCGDTYVDSFVGALGHAWGEWVTTTPAQVGVPGVETRVCAHDSSHVETREIPALEPGLAITSQPQSVSTVAGKTITFKVVADGSNPTYQWQYKTPSGSWKNSPATGNKTATLKVPATIERNNYQYRCIVTDAYGTVLTSNAATLTVAVPAAITGDPSDVMGKIGAVAAFAVEAEGLNLTYQWQYSEDGGATWKNSTNKSAVAVCKVTEARDGRLYRCVVTDEFGNTATSDTAKLTCIKPLAITTQPADVSTTAGKTVNMKVVATGTNLTYQWQYKTPTGSWKNSTGTGNKTDTLSISATTGRANYQFRCIVTDISGNKATSNAAKLTVFGIKTQPKDVTAAKGTTATMKVVATGENLTYQWQYLKSDGTWANTTLTGAKTATLSIPATAARNGNQYRCVVKSGSNTLTSNAAKITVK